MTIQKSDYEKSLTGLFEELYDYWAEKTPLTPASEKLVDDLFLPIHSTTGTCFFATIHEVLPLYESMIFPIFEKYGFKPFTYRDISVGVNILASISSAIERSSLVVIDITTQKANSVLHESAMAIEKGHTVLIIKEEDAILPHYLYKQSVKILTRPHDLESDEMNSFISKLDEFLLGFLQKIKTDLSDEPMRLLHKQEYKSAVVSAFAVLETTLTRKLQVIMEKEDIHHISFRKLIDLSLHHKLIDDALHHKIREWYVIRSSIVHSGSDIDSEKASSIVREIVVTSKRIGKLR